MEKTALQQLIERLNKSIIAERDVLDCPNLYHQNDVSQARLLVSNVEQIISIAIELLPAERDAIVEAHKAGDPFNNIHDAEQYYETRYGSSLK